MPAPEVKVRISAVDLSRPVLDNTTRSLRLMGGNDVHRGLKKTASAVTNLGLSMVGVQGNAARLVDGLLLMGAGGVVTLALTAGILIIAKAYELLTGKARAAAKAQKELNEEMDKAIESRNPIPKLTKAAEGYSKQVTDLNTRLTQLRATHGTTVLVEAGVGPDPQFIHRQIDNTKEITKLEAERTATLARMNEVAQQLGEAFGNLAPDKVKTKKIKPEIFDNTAPRGAGNTVAGGGLGGTGTIAADILGGRMRPGGPNANRKSPLQEALEREAAAVLETARELQGQLALGIADSLGDGIANGLAAAITNGGIGAGFKALAQTLLAGIGQAMVQFGKASLAASILMQKIKAALASLNPGAAIAASIAMIAIGATLSAAASSAFGGSASNGYASRGLSDTVTRVTVPTPSASQSTASLSAQRPLIYAPTYIGKTDQAAQRELVEMLSLASDRGHKVRR